MAIARPAPTPGDAARIATARKNGLEALGRIKGEATWEDWMMIGEAMMTFTEEAMIEVGATEWTEDNRQLHKAFVRLWEAYEATDGSNQKPLSKQERWALRYVMMHPEIGAWRAEIRDGSKRRRITHPNKVIEAYKRQHADTSGEKKPSPVAKRDEAIRELEERGIVLNQTIADLQNQVHELEAARETGSGFTFPQLIDLVVNHMKDIPHEADRHSAIDRLAKTVRVQAFGNKMPKSKSAKPKLPKPKSRPNRKGA